MNKQHRAGFFNPRNGLLAGVSALAVAVAAPHALAADIPILTKAPAAPARGDLTFFLEGGGFWTGGDQVASSFDTATGESQFGLRPRLGWDAAIGFDYRFATSPWHVNMQFRYGEAKSSTSSFAAPIASPGLVGSTTSTGTDKETHWLADFAVGRDVGIGPASVQVKAGMRIAELTSQSSVFTTANLAVTGIPTGEFNAISETILNQQNTSFRGIGPRLGLQGALPLGGGWQVDYLGDIALLFGTRRLDNPLSSSETLGLAPPLSGSEILSTVSATAHEVGAMVPNLDAQIGLSYWLSPNAKLTASYRIDAFYGALITFDSKGNEKLMDRIFSGPQLSLTATFSPDPGPSVGSADRPTVAGMFYKAVPFVKAPSASAGGQLTVFGEGGGFWTGGDPIYTFYGTGGDVITPGFFALKPKFGWDTGGGLDYRFAGTPWHVSAQFLYGLAKGSGAASGSFAVGGIVAGPSTESEAVSEAVTASQQETHWLADFAVGRDVAIGAESVQVKAGIRVAELTAKTSALDSDVENLTISPPVIIGAIPVTGALYSTTVDDEQQSKFIGTGPRLGVEGSVPLGASWSLDYLGDTAVLFGAQRFQTIKTGTSTATTIPPGAASLPPASSSIAFFYQTNAAVFNADLQAGISYWFNPNVKLTASYRLDAFFGALSTLNSAGATTKVDRYYQGPRLILTGNF
jgi:hypothetical protein